MKIVRKQGSCSCGFDKKIIKDEFLSSIRFYYENEQRSILINCVNCGRKIKKSFILDIATDPKKD